MNMYIEQEGCARMLRAAIRHIIKCHFMRLLCPLKFYAAA